jgi:hypothetical protein
MSIVLACAALASVSPCVASSVAKQGQYFEIDVVDAQTSRGVPLVELRTVNNVRYYTDSAGVVAVGDPELIGQDVYFHIKSPGYHYAKDQFGYSGIALKVVPGGKAVVKIDRDNIAERLYRVTGAGIYRDSVLVDRSVPIKHPLINGLVMGQDTVEVTPYRGKLYWFFGDTDRPPYPLGQFATSGATSLLPGDGGLDPAKGVDLTYWVDSSGFSRPMIPIKNASGPVWVGGLFTLREDGQEHLYTHYAMVNGGMTPTLSGLAEFDDHDAVFKSIHTYDLKNPLRPEGEPFLVNDDGTHYLYCETAAMGAFPLVRNLPKIADLTDSSTYESFTCLKPGARYAGVDTPLDRTADGRLIWGWKRDTAPLGEDQANDLVKKGVMRQDEVLASLHDVDTDAVVLSHGGSVFWNAYRKRWIMITTQAYGTPSFLGEVWFAEADTPVGPWLYAKKIATHDHYTFYNPTQHPFFDQDGGRLIYFEGTYTDTFSDVKDITPRYNYNQLMYRLALDDRRLALPAPVYRLKDAEGHYGYGQREQIDSDRAQWTRVDAIPFYAIPASRSHDGLIAVYASSTDGDMRLSTTPTSTGETPLFYALPSNPTANEKMSPAVKPLYEYTDTGSSRRWYAIGDDAVKWPNATRSAEPLCRVWRNPSNVTTFDFGAEPD